MRLWHLLVISTVFHSYGYCMELTGLFGRITSPEFLKPYPNDKNITWDIRVPEGHRIKIYFTHFNLELSYLCEYDYVKLTSKGKVVAHFCGTESTDTEKTPENLPYYSLNNRMSVNFRSDFSNEKEFTGFEAFYTAEDIDECEKHDEDIEICDHFCHNHIGGYYCSCRAGFKLHTDKKTCIVKCDDMVYTTSQGEIVSPEFPEIYPKLTTCRYRIQAEEGFSILLKFLDFDVESHPDVLCPYDRLQITAGEKDLSLCGGALPPEIDTKNNTVDIVFTSDGSGHHKGWKLQYKTKALPCPDPVLPPKGKFTPKQESYVVKDKLTVSCEEGYTLEQNGRTLDSFTAVCRTDGTWDKPLPKCEIANCGPPRVLKNGDFTYENGSEVTTYKAQILYKCAKKFYKMKENQAQYECGKDGDWVQINTVNETIPTCIPDCGVKKSERIGRVYGGKNAKLGDFPWQVLITYESVIGGGALINDQWITTAAHVIQNKNQRDIKIKMGIINRTDPGACKAVIKSVFIHPGYDPESYNNDIALIKVQDTVPLSEDILPICLPSNDERFRISHTGPNTVGEVSGWGRTETSRRPTMLQYVDLDIIDQVKCKQAYQKEKSTITDNMFCAGREEGDKQDSCGGDSGSALVFPDKNSGKWFMGGLVSWGIGECGSKTLFGVYTNVRNYLDWIQEIISKNTN